MSIHLGSANELAIDAEYHDPSDIDKRLGGTRIIPMWLTVKNTSSKPVPLSYQDMRLDLGSASSTTPLSPIEGGAARAMLRRDGHYNAFLRFLSSQGNDYERDPFSQSAAERLARSGENEERIRVFHAARCRAFYRFHGARHGFSQSRDADDEYV